MGRSVTVSLPNLFVTTSLHPVAVADVDRPVEVLALLDVLDRLLGDVRLHLEEAERARHEIHAPEDEDARRE